MSQIEAMILRGQTLVEQNLNNENEEVVQWKEDSRRLVRSLYGKGSKEDKEMRADNISTRLMVLRTIQETKRTTEPNQVVYNVHGNNARINLYSTDNSSNVVNMTSENLFAELKKVIQGNVNDEIQRTEIIDAVDNLEQTQNTPRFIDSYQRFIGLAVNHMELITPFIPALTNMLS